MPGFLYFTPSEEAPSQEGAWKDGPLTKTACRGVTAGPGPASMDVNESPSPHIAINTYSTNRQEAAMGKSPNQHFKTTPQQRHQSARIVTCLSALMSSTLQCVFQTASFPLTKTEWRMTSSLTRWGGGRRGEHAERIGWGSEVLTAIYSQHARMNSKTMIRRASSSCDLNLNWLSTKTTGVDLILSTCSLLIWILWVQTAAPCLYSIM